MRALLRLGAALLATSLLPAAADGAALKMFPVRIVLTPKESVQTMTIENESPDPSRVQLRVYAWRQENGEDVLEETRDILANPALFEIGPGGVQIARFGLRTTPGAVEKSYRVFLEEVPGTRPTQPGEVQTLLRISIPIFVPAPDAVGRLVWRAWPVGSGKVAFAIRNAGTAHVQVNRLTLRRKDGTALGTQNMSIYLLPGTAKQVTLDVGSAVRAGEALKLDAMTDQADLSLDLVSEAPSSETGRP